MPTEVLSPMPAARGSTGKPRFKTAHAEAVELQRLLMRKAREPDIRPAELSGVSRAYVELEECKRKLRMKPLPKAIDVTKDGKPKRSRSNHTSEFKDPTKESL